MPTRTAGQGVQGRTGQGMVGRIGGQEMAARQCELLRRKQVPP